TGERKCAIAAMLRTRAGNRTRSRLPLGGCPGVPSCCSAEPDRPMRIALFEPDIPQNTGTILRLAACLGVEAHLIEPAGFPTSDRAFRRAGMDYLDQVALVRHVSWGAFESWRRAQGLRLVLFTTQA